MNFIPYPFEKLRALLKDSIPRDFRGKKDSKNSHEDSKIHSKRTPKDELNQKMGLNARKKPSEDQNLKDGLNLSIGEPGFEAPDVVIATLQESASLVRYYPTMLDELAKSQIDFIARRFNVRLSINQVVPTFGTREVLFNFPQFVFLDSKNASPVMAFPNPFYQIYEGVQVANNAQVIYMPLTEYNNYKPQLDKSELKKLDLVILNSPNNPTGQALSLDELTKWVEMALKYDFILINDECYSEIYTKKAPASILQASIKAGNAEFRNVFAINSLSKRISVPGLRSGFIAGDSRILQKYRIFRTYVGISIPLTLQKASIIGWEQDEYAEKIRQKFKKNMETAGEIFKDSVIFPYTFYLWLKVQECNDIHLNENRLFNDELFCKELYENTGHIVLPGSYLGRNGGGIGYVRIALTKEEEQMKIALRDIKEFYDDFVKTHGC